MTERAAVAASISRPTRFTPWRWCLAGVGLFLFGLGGVGAVIPGMPTTIFVLVGSVCLTKSCPWLEERLLRSRLFRPYAEFVRSTEPLSRRARLAATAMMWASIVASTAVLALAGRMTPALAAVFAGLGLLGTVSIAMFRRRPGRSW